MRSPYTHSCIAVMDVLKHSKVPLSAADLGRATRRFWTGKKKFPRHRYEPARLQKVLPRLRGLGFITRLPNRRRYKFKNYGNTWHGYGLLYELTPEGLRWLDDTLANWSNLYGTASDRILPRHIKLRDEDEEV